MDFKENVRPLRVLTALHWLVNNSELYKESDIVIDDNWFQEVTESAEDTVREFLKYQQMKLKTVLTQRIQIFPSRIKKLLKLMAMILIGTVR